MKLAPSKIWGTNFKTFFRFGQGVNKVRFKPNKLTEPIKIWWFGSILKIVRFGLVVQNNAWFKTEPSEIGCNQN